MSNAAPNGNGNGGYGGFYTVESIHGTDEFDTYYIKQGTGLKATRIQLKQGRSYSITVVDDTNMIPPSAETYLSLVDTVGGGASIYLFRVISNGYSANREVEGKREITCEYLTLIEGGGSVIED